MSKKHNLHLGRFDAPVHFIGETTNRSRFSESQLYFLRFNFESNDDFVLMQSNRFVLKLRANTTVLYSAGPNSFKHVL